MKSVLWWGFWPLVYTWVALPYVLPIVAVLVGLYLGIRFEVPFAH